jgi:putative redox protein
MANDLTVRAVLETGLSFDVETGSGHHIILDTTEAGVSKNAGPSPMETLLVGLAGCSAMDILALLRKKRQNVSAYEVRVQGKRAQEHPKVFVEIALEHILTGHNIQPEAVQRSIQLSEERYCGASAMLGETATITHTLRILEEEG